MKAILSLIISGALVVSGLGQTRNVLVGTNNAVIQPTNFWSADAANARTGLGLGTAATNPASAFQPSSATLSNLAASNGASLTNLAASNIVGALSLSQGGTGATNASDARAALGLGTAATNPSSAFQPSSTVLSNLASSNGINLTNLQASNIIGIIAISNGGSGATTAGGARTNLELGTTNSVLFGSVTVDDLEINSTYVIWGGLGRIEWETRILLGGGWTIDGGPLIIGGGTNSSLYQAQTRTNIGLGWSALTNTTASGFQTALFGTGTNPVLVNTNGEVVSPTNFWQAAPITTTFVESQPNTNFTTNISAARFLHIHSLATNIVNVTNTIVLPTNGTTFDGDIALVVHQGPTNSMTRVRTAGSTNDLVTMTRFDEAVEFVYYNNVWQFNHNQAFVEPIFFSGTNASANAAASRTNLGLGTTNDVEFSSLRLTSISTNGALIFSDQSRIIGESDLYIGATSLFFTTPPEFAGTNAAELAATTRTNLGLGATNNSFSQLTAAGDSNKYIVLDSGEFFGDWNFDNAANFQDGISSSANIVITNQSTATNGLLYIYRTNNEPFLGLANLIASNNVTVSNETLFRVGASEATNKAAQFGFRSTNTNGNGVAVFSVFGYNALMMIGPSDPNAGTNPIQATVYSIAPTNKVMTLITTNTGATLFHRAIEFENTTNQAVTRTNLGLPLAALTNTTVTNFQKAIFYTNTAPTNVGGNLGTIAAWIEIVASNGVTYKIPAYTNVP